MQNNTVKDSSNKGNSANKMTTLSRNTSLPQASVHSINTQPSSSAKDNSFKPNFFQFPTRDSIASDYVNTQEEKKIDDDDDDEGIKHESSSSLKQQQP